MYPLVVLMLAISYQRVSRLGDFVFSLEESLSNSVVEHLSLEIESKAGRTKWADRL